MYPNGYIEFRSNGGGCWSYIGQVMTTGSQTINLSNGCVHQLIIEHEVLHAMGMYHEQSRPDRDMYIQVNYANIQPDYHSQYKLIYMNTWHDDGVVYDPESIMHYPYYGFLTTYASFLGLSAMTGLVYPYKGKPVQKPRQTRMSGRDAIQLQLMYKDYCPPLAQGLCKDGAPYLMANKCDGHGDCAFAEDCNVDCDHTDETNCDAICPMVFKVESSDENDNNQFIGTYKHVGTYTDAQYWMQVNSDNVDRYAYRTPVPYNYWQFGLTLGGTCLMFGYDVGSTSSTGCPTDSQNSWWKAAGGTFISYRQLSVSKGNFISI